MVSSKSTFNLEADESISFDVGCLPGEPATDSDSLVFFKILRRNMSRHTWLGELHLNAVDAIVQRYQVLEIVKRSSRTGTLKKVTARAASGGFGALSWLLAKI